MVVLCFRCQSEVTPQGECACQDGICLIHGDSRETMPFLESGGIELVLTDPPYGIDYQSAWRIDRQRKPKIEGDKQYPLWLFNLEPKIALFAWCRWDVLPELPRPKSFIVWDKGRHSMGDLHHEFGRQWEACAFYPGKSHRFTKRPIDVIRCPCIPPGKLVHPNEKPVGALIPLLTSHPPGTVIDPFAGSGTTGRACKDLGRRCVMIEIEERYCQIAAERLYQEVLFT